MTGGGARTLPALGPGPPYLGLELVHATAARLLDGAQHLGFPLLQGLEQTLEVLGGTPLR